MKQMKTHDMVHPKAGMQGTDGHTMGTRDRDRPEPSKGQASRVKKDKQAAESKSSASARAKWLKDFDDKVAQESMASFPASDSPSWTPERLGGTRRHSA